MQEMTVTALDDETLRNAMAYTEQIDAVYRRESLELDREPPFGATEYAHPTLWFQSTYDVDGAVRNAAATKAIASAAAQGMVSAGYLEVSALGDAVARPEQSMLLYYPSTQARYSVTVRAPDGSASGWAGCNWNDWHRLDVDKLSATALDKCLRSRNPSVIEPGRYTAILEPQAVYDLCAPAIGSVQSWGAALSSQVHPYSDGSSPVGTKIGQRLIDERLSVSSDPTDPDAGFVPFDRRGEPYYPARWFDRGVLTHLAYDRRFGVERRVGNHGLLCSGSFRMDVHGPTSTVDEMIAATTRGVLVTRFWNLQLLDPKSLLSSGYTRDGLWLVEHGKISRPVKNFRITESPLFVLNQVEQVGAPQRVFAPGMGAVVPALRVRDFSFTSLSDAV